MINEEAIVLRSTQYKETDRIITLLTKEAGILSVMAKRISHKDLKMHSLASPLHRGEYILSPINPDLFRLKDGHILDTYVEVRRSFAHLKVALELLDLTEKSQMPGEAAPLLYLLLSSYLTALKVVENPQLLKISYVLKLLRHEGIYDAEEFSSKIDLLAHIKSFKELIHYEIDAKELEEAHLILNAKIHQMGAG
jgi:DNA repair protein RecO (recombination protein O)